MASTSTSSPLPPRDSSVSSSSTAGGRNNKVMNGLRGKLPKPANEKDISTRTESNTPDSHSHDRLLFLLAHFVGFPVLLTTQSGQRYTGIFSGASLDGPDPRFVLKMVKKTKDSSSATSNGASDDEPYIGHGADHVMDFARDDMIDLKVTGVTFDKSQSRQANGATSAFRTDTDISGNKLLRERELVAWQPSEGDLSSDLSMAPNGDSRWDQFEVNARLYGVKTDYDENMYTTQIDRSAPSYKDRAAAAERKAREIEGISGGSFQAREDANDEDEEARFSGVQRDAQPSNTPSNKYTHPARRPPTGQPTVSGAPVDPAIISSQLARPNPLEKSLSNTGAPSQPTEKKENVPAGLNAEGKTDEASSTTTKAALDLPSGRPPLLPTNSKSPNATETVERDVLKSFKDFSAGEKMRVQEQQRKQLRRDKEVKLNDLKKFSENFRLPRAVPEDMLGILAKDKRKQEEILKKSVHDAGSKKSPTKESVTPDTTKAEEPQPKQADAASRPTESNVTAPIPVEPAGQGQRGRGHGSRGAANGRGGGGTGRGMAQDTFGQRKMRQYGPGPHGTVPPMIPPGPPFAVQTAELPINRSSHAPTPSSATSSRFNVAAHEFKPNPTAAFFSPSGNTQASSVTSQTNSRPVSKAHSPSKKSFFDGQRPKPAAEHKSIRDGFNPVKRMKVEAEADGKAAKDFAQNDGIPYAYATRPTWDAGPENADKSYDELFDKNMVPNPAMAAGNGPHQHQLPPNLPAGGGVPFQQQAPRFAQSPMHHGQREPFFEDNRMQYSASQQGMYGSPRTQPGMMMQHSPMAGQAQPVYGMPQPGMFGPGQQMPMVGYNPRPGSMPPQMPMPQGQQFMMPGQPGQMMYSPGPGQIYPAPGPHTPGGYPSPRPPPMMAHQGSQQGHAPPMMYAGGSQQGYYMPQPGQPMRGAYPMQQQGSYGASPHMQYQYPMQGTPRGPQQQYHQYQQQPHGQGGPHMHHPPPNAGSEMK